MAPNPPRELEPGEEYWTADEWEAVGWVPKRDLTETIVKNPATGKDWWK